MLASSVLYYHCGRLRNLRAISFYESRKTSEHMPYDWCSNICRDRTFTVYYHRYCSPYTHISHSTDHAIAPVFSRISRRNRFNHTVAGLKFLCCTGIVLDTFFFFSFHVVLVELATEIAGNLSRRLWKYATMCRTGVIKPGQSLISDEFIIARVLAESYDIIVAE